MDLVVAFDGFTWIWLNGGQCGGAGSCRGGEKGYDGLTSPLRGGGLR